MAVRKINGHWVVDIPARKTGGKRARWQSPHNSKGSAKEYEVQLLQKLARGEELDPPKPPEEAQSFAEFAAEWHELYACTNNKPSEQAQKRYALHGHLIPVFGATPLDAISAKAIEEYKASRLKLGLKAKTINNHLSVLHKCLTTAVAWDVIADVPRVTFLKTEPPGFRFLTEAQAEQLVAHVAEPTWRAMLLTAMKTGLRFHELIALEWCDVDLDRAEVRVRRGNVRGRKSSNKVNRIRLLPFTSDVAAALRRLHRGEHNDLVFSIDGRWIRHTRARNWLIRVSAEAGVPYVGWHALRHTYASHLVAAGASLKAVQDLMGHSNINMTMRYSHLNMDALRRAASLLEPATANENGQRLGISAPLAPFKGPRQYP